MMLAYLVSSFLTEILRFCVLIEPVLASICTDFDLVDVLGPGTDLHDSVIATNGFGLIDALGPDSVKSIVCTNRVCLIFVYFLAHTFDFGITYKSIFPVYWTVYSAPSESTTFAGLQSFSGRNVLEPCRRA